VYRADSLTIFMYGLPAIWEPQTPGTLKACPGVLSDCFRFTVYPGASCSKVSCHPVGVMLSTGA